VSGGGDNNFRRLGSCMQSKKEVSFLTVQNNEENQINVVDKILIKGSTTGEQELIIEEMFVNEIASAKGVAGDTCTFKLPFRIRLSDKLYKILND
jgi:hypothetical protein